MKKVSMVPLALVVCSGLLGGCASVPMTAPTLDEQAKQFAPESGKANIYVYRGGGMGAGLAIRTVLDGRVVGSVAQNTFHLLSVTPGQHIITVLGGESVNQQKVSAEAGRSYFYKISIHTGWAAGRPQVEPVAEEQGRKEVMGARRAQSSSYQ